jgi:hypothetical protein
MHLKLKIYLLGHFGRHIVHNWITESDRIKHRDGPRVCHTRSKRYSSPPNPIIGTRPRYTADFSLGQSPWFQFDCRHGWQKNRSGYAGEEKCLRLGLNVFDDGVTQCWTYPLSEFYLFTITTFRKLVLLPSSGDRWAKQIRFCPLTGHLNTKVKPTSEKSWFKYKHLNDGYKVQKNNYKRFGIDE